MLDVLPPFPSLDSPSFAFPLPIDPLLMSCQNVGFSAPLSPLLPYLLSPVPLSLLSLS